MRLLRSHTLILLALLASGEAVSQAEFVENLGQWPEQVKFRANIPSGELFLEEAAFTYALVDPGVHDFIHPEEVGMEPPTTFDTHAYQVQFIGGFTYQVEGQKPTGPFYNFYLGDDESSWANGAKGYGKLMYENLYHEIDLRVYSKTHSIKYDFLVNPGGDPSELKLHVEGANFEITDGEIHIHTIVGDVIEKAPYAYQVIGGKVKEVECHYELVGENIEFSIGEYDMMHQLIIDPEVAFASYIGSTASNFGFTATDDSDGNLIAGACVFATGYPTTLGAVQTDFNNGLNSYCDAVVTKFNAEGDDLIYSTYLGGSGLEMPHSLIVDSDDNWIVMGTTGSSDFPTTGGVYQENLIGGPAFDFSSFFIPSSHYDGCDFFVSKFNADGSGLYASTFVGGNATDGLNIADKLFYNYGDSFRGEIIVDADDNILVASNTSSTDFPIVGGPQGSFGGGVSDGVLFKLDADLEQMLWSTYIGGSGDDSAYSVQVNSLGKIVACGGTKSGNMPVTGGASDESYDGDVDGFIVRYNGIGSIVEACTYVGTTEYDQCYFVQIDSDDNVYVIGQTEGVFAPTPGVYVNPTSGQFISKFEPDLSAVVWQTTIGTGSGAIDISPTAFLVSDCDQIYFSGWGGWTNSLNSNYATESTTTGLPITADAYQDETDGSDFYLCVLSPDAEELVYATFFGGYLSREHVDGGTSKFDKDGSVYQAVCAGCGGYDDFPTTPGAWSDDNGSTNCNLGVFKFNLGAIQAQIEIDGPEQVCEGAPVPFINNSTGGTTYEWSFGDGNTSNEFEPVHIYEDSDFFEVTLVVTDDGGCLAPDSTTIVIEILHGVNPMVDPVDPVCEGESVMLNVDGTENVYWLDDPTLSATDIPNPVATPVQPTTYYAVDVNECESDTVGVFVDFVSVNTNVSQDQTICIGESIEISAEGGASYVWSPPNWLSNPLSDSPTAAPEETTTYVVEITTAENCEVVDSVTIYVVQDPPGGQTYPDIGLCTGYSVELMAMDGYDWLWSPAGSLSDPNLQNPIASPTDTTTYTVEIWNACGSGFDQVTVNIIEPQAVSGSDGDVCLGQWYPVWASGGEEYWWEPANFVDDPTSPTPNVSPPETTTFTAYVTDEYGCTASSTVNVIVLPLPEVDAGHPRKIDIFDIAHIFGFAEGIDFWWEPDYNIDCTDCIAPLVWPEEDTWYSLFTIDEHGCVNKDSVLIEVFHPVFVPNAFTPDNDGINDVFMPVSGKLRNFEMHIHNRWGELIFTTDEISKPWDGSVRGSDHYVQIGVYIWTVWYDAREGRKMLQGHVTVVR